MKNRTIPILLLLGTLLLVVSCSKDPCKKVECGTQGYCVDGDCACNSGWIFDADGKCNERDLCYGKDCANGSCNPATGQCDCNTGWTTDADGHCTVQDPCSGLDCGVHGSCNPNTGTCACDPGYTLDANNQCNVAIRDLYIGTWYGTHTVNGGTVVGPYTFTITSVPSDVERVNINNAFGIYCNSLGQPFRLVGYISTPQASVLYVSSTCSEIGADAQDRGFWLLTDNDLKGIVEITYPGTIQYLIGTYVRQ